MQSMLHRKETILPRLVAIYPAIGHLPRLDFHSSFQPPASDLSVHEEQIAGFDIQ